jgi:hypothetical protein
MDHDADHAESPVAAMTARVAALWRSQGDDFLAIYDADAAADISRLRKAVITEPLAPEGERIVDRLRRLDAAAVERVAAGRPGAVVDLRSDEPTVTVPNEEDGEPFAVRRTTCRRCHRVYPDDAFVPTSGDKVKPLCLDCAMVVAGVRRR